MKKRELLLYDGAVDFNSVTVTRTIFRTKTPINIPARLDPSTESVVFDITRPGTTVKFRDFDGTPYIVHRDGVHSTRCKVGPIHEIFVDKRSREATFSGRTIRDGQDRSVGRIRYS